MNDLLGFVTAESEWLKEKANKSFIELYCQIPAEAVYRRAYIENKFKGFIAGEEPFSTLFWKVFNTECWMRTFISGPRGFVA